MSNIFESFTLTKEEIYGYAITFSLILTSICVISKITIKTTKSLAWVISFINSTVMTVVAAVYISYYGVKYIDLVKRGEYATEIYHTRNDYVVLACLWFGLANIFDIAFGLLFYPKYIDILTGWIHHSVYLWIMYFSTTGDGIITTARPFAPCFVIASIEEIPTFLLALGSIFPTFRTDIGFGLTFFLLRICFHIFLMGYAYYSKVDTAVTVIYSLTLTLHINWFYTWVTKYGSKLFKQKDNKKK